MFITFVTRCCKRPDMLRQNIESVNQQTSSDHEQIFIVDRVGRGIVWANKQLYQNRECVRGDYVFILDDDKVLYDHDFVSKAQAIAEQHNQPEVIMTKTKACHRGVLPKDKYWERRDLLESPCINEGNYVVRADIWKKYIRHFGYPDTISGAWKFPKHFIEDNSCRFVWLDVIASKALRLSRGKIDKSLGENWFEKFSKSMGGL